MESSTRSGAPGPIREAGHPALEAFRYFAAEGMRAEAVACARDYFDAAGCPAHLYGEARSAGLENLCLELVAACPGLFGDKRVEYMYPYAYGAEIDREAVRYSLPAAMILAVIREESRFDETALSPAGAHGLMQLMPSTGDWIGPKIGRDRAGPDELFDPGFNIAAGCWYLRFLLDRGDDSIVAALASYNAGHGRMKRWKMKFSPDRDPLAAIELIGPEETRRYVRRVLDSMAAYSRITSGSIH